MSLSALPQDWPNRENSRFVRRPVHDWHVQERGSGKQILLLHGAGGSAHCFAGLFPLLAQDHHVLAPDLPGHGFTRLGAQRRSGLAEMATDITALCKTLDFAPDAIIGHSAGGAIALQMARTRPDLRVIGINPALDHFDGIAGVVFPVVAKLLAAVPFTGRLFSGASARPDRIKALIDGTGSQISEEGLRHYQTLVSRESHVNGALSMMAQWSLTDLLSTLPEITARTLMITGAKDKTVPPSVADKAAALMPNANVIKEPDYGHLIHEEHPDLVFDHCVKFLRSQ